MAQRLKRLPAMRETWVQSLVWEDPLEKEMATHSSILAWRIPWTEEPGGLQYTGSQRVGHDWATNFSIDHLVMSMCRVVSCVVGRGHLLWPVHSLGKTLLAFVLLHLYSKAKFACYSRYLLTSYFCILVPYDEKDIFFLVLVLEDLVGLHRTIQLQLLWH